MRQVELGELLGEHVVLMAMGGHVGESALLHDVLFGREVADHMLNEHVQNLIDDGVCVALAECGIQLSSDLEESLMLMIDLANVDAVTLVPAKGMIYPHTLNHDSVWQFGKCAVCTNHRDATGSMSLAEASRNGVDQLQKWLCSRLVAFDLLSELMMSLFEEMSDFSDKSEKFLKIRFNRRRFVEDLPAFFRHRHGCPLLPIAHELSRVA